MSAERLPKAIRITGCTPMHPSFTPWYSNRIGRVFDFAGVANWNGEDAWDVHTPDDAPKVVGAVRRCDAEPIYDEESKPKRVRVIKGTHSGEPGTVVRTEGELQGVQLDMGGELIFYHWSSLKLLSDEAKPEVKPLTRADILNTALECVTKDRNATHGEPEDNFSSIAALWGAYKGQPFDAKDVAVMCALIKVARIKTSPEHRDNWTDLAGYAACGGEIAMNRTVELEKEGGR